MTSFAARLREVDTVHTASQHPIHGLDFGVREWVMDLPWPSKDKREQSIVVELLRNHRRHIASAVEFDVPVPGLRATLLDVGVVRGARLRVDGELANRSGDDPLPRDVRGVMRTCHLHRAGLEVERRLLRHVGMRLAGGARFVQLVRAK